MPNPLFSTYSQGENRVTGTLLSLLEHISTPLVQHLLSTLLEEEVDLLSFENQPTGSTSSSVPDARIHASFSFWIETKTEPDSVRKTQLRNHLEELDEGHSGHRLLVLTPDPQEPDEIASIRNQMNGQADGQQSPGEPGQLVWSNFATLVDAIRGLLEPDDVLDADQAYPTARERELLREFAQFVYAEQLVNTIDDEILLVAAGKALPEYREHGVYICQPNRSFRPTRRMSFYSDKTIHQWVPLIRDRVEEVTLDPEGIEQWIQKRNGKASEGDTVDRLRSLVDSLKEAHTSGRPGGDRYGEAHKVLFLSDADEDDTEILDASVKHRESGAFVQGHRYVPTDWLLDESGPPETTDSFPGSDS